MGSDDRAETGGPPQPRPESVEFVTTEHFTLQGARTTATTESTGRATTFLGAVSAGMVALGFVAQATQLGAGFYAFGLILLITLSFVGFATFDRALQAGVEDLHYAQRIARLRGFYFDFAPELAGYLASVPPQRRLAMQGLHGGRLQILRTMSGMVAVVTAVLVGSACGLLAALAAGHSSIAGYIAGGLLGVAALLALMRYQLMAWRQASAEVLFPDDEGPQTGS